MYFSVMSTQDGSQNIQQKGRKIENGSQAKGCSVKSEDGQKKQVEKWRQIPGWEDRYEVSNLGNIKSLKRATKSGVRGGGMMRPTKNNKGYFMACLCRYPTVKLMSVARLVATMFIPNPNNYPQVNHISGIKTDNSKKNLEWCTSRHNLQHARRMGLLVNPSGEACSSSKLSQVQVNKLREDFGNGESQASLAKRYKLLPSTVSSVVTGKSWKLSFRGFTGREKSGRCKINPEIVFESKKLRELGFSFAEIGRKFSASRATITNAVNGTSWKHLV